MSPTIFYNGNYLGGWDQLLKQVQEKMGMTEVEFPADATKKCVRREFEAFNMTDTSFVTLTIHVDHESLEQTEKKQLVIELYEKICPKTCKRFKDLCDGNFLYKNKKA